MIRISGKKRKSLQFPTHPPPPFFFLATKSNGGSCMKVQPSPAGVMGTLSVRVGQSSFIDTFIQCLTTLQIWGILVQMNPHSFTLSYISSLPMVMGIWVSQQHWPLAPDKRHHRHSSIQRSSNRDGSRPGEPAPRLLAILVQSAGSLMDPWKQRRNQTSPYVQDGQPRGILG